MGATLSWRGGNARKAGIYGMLMKEGRGQGGIGTCGRGSGSMAIMWQLSSVFLKNIFPLVIF